MQLSVLNRWLVLAGLIVVAFIVTVVSLNLTLYSGPGFVSSYLSALERHDPQGALAMPGVESGSPTGAAAGVPAASNELLASSTLGALSHIALVSDRDDGSGQHTVTYSYRLGSVRSETAFVVRHTGSRLGFFSGWTFVTTPLSTLQITPLHGTTFAANGITLSPAPVAGIPHRYRVLAPAAVALSYQSTYLEAPRTAVLVNRTNAEIAADVDIRANSAFVAEVSKQLRVYLDACVTQKVLLPTGCPMGKQITDRIQDEPVWSMVAYPNIAIVPGSDAQTWQIEPTQGTAHLVVRVKSIFDGSLSTFNQDVPFTVKYLIVIRSDGGLDITAQ